MKIAHIIIKQIISSKLNVFLGLVFSDIIRRLYSDEVHFGFYYDLGDKIELPYMSTPLTVRKLGENDIIDLFIDNTDILSAVELKARIERLLFIKSGIPTCYVGVLESGAPVVLNWVITHDSNDMLKSYFKGGLPALKQDEVLFEYIFTPPAWRGKKFHGYLTKALLVESMKMGKKKAFCFVSGKNKLSIKVTDSFGWQCYLIKRVQRRFFRKKVTFEPYKKPGDEIK